MGLVSKEISRAELKPGDHIYSWRSYFYVDIYAHHGIYVGEGIVIHFTSSSSASSATGNPCPRCRYHSGLGGVISSCVDCFVAGGDLCLFEYDVSIPYFLGKFAMLAEDRGGTCTIASSDSPEDVLHRARYLLKNGFGAYDLFRKNCVDFAIYCKTGRILIARQAVVLPSIPYLAMGLAGLPTFSLPLTNEIALVKAKKIPVEILVSRYLSR